MVTVCLRPCTPVGVDRQSVPRRANISDWVGPQAGFRGPPLLVNAVRRPDLRVRAPACPGLLAGPASSAGISVGLTTATATAYLGELHVGTPRPAHRLSAAPFPGPFADPPAKPGRPSGFGPPGRGAAGPICAASPLRAALHSCSAGLADRAGRCSSRSRPETAEPAVSGSAAGGPQRDRGTPARAPDVLSPRPPRGSPPFAVYGCLQLAGSDVPGRHAASALACGRRARWRFAAFAGRRGSRRSRFKPNRQGDPPCGSARCFLLPGLVLLRGRDVAVQPGAVQSSAAWSPGPAAAWSSAARWPPRVCDRPAGNRGPRCWPATSSAR